MSGNGKPSAIFSAYALAGSITLLLLALLLATGLVFAALHYRNQIEREHQAAQAQLAESSARLARVREDEREIRAKIDRYGEIIARGHTEPEHRLEWVETLRGIREQRRLISMEYEIAPQRPLDPKTVVTGGYSFLTSTMKLDMLLLHENDLLGLLADLSAQVDALVSVRQCTLERLNGAPQAHPAALLRARCEIDWITLQEKP
ncbi:MAG: hypothetical protein KGZ43_02150 [Sulfuritalea sp.]|nr:hypothetical protein [Sulfuritalea sp.]